MVYFLMLVVALALAALTIYVTGRVLGKPSQDYCLAASIGTSIVGGLALLVIAFYAQKPQYGLFMLCLGLAIGLPVWVCINNLRHGYKVRRSYEAYVLTGLATAATIAIMTTAGILFAMVVESWRFFQQVSLIDFLFGTEWSPQIAIREDQAGSSGKFGMLPLLSGTLLISAIALVIALPLGITIAIYLAEFADKRLRDKLKPALEYLAGVPTVVYGFFAVVVISPLIHDAGAAVGIAATSETALASGLMIAAVILPFIISFTEDALFAVPDNLRLGSLALGATRLETVFRVVCYAAIPGIAAGLMLAFSRAVGETMIVVMAAGLSANFTINPLESVTTITVQIVTLLTGDQEFDDPKTLAAFGLGLLLFVFTLVMNFVALVFLRKYQDRYE